MASQLNIHVNDNPWCAPRIMLRICTNSLTQHSRLLPAKPFSTTHWLSQTAIFQPIESHNTTFYHGAARASGWNVVISTVRHEHLLRCVADTCANIYFFFHRICLWIYFCLLFPSIHIFCSGSRVKLLDSRAYLCAFTVFCQRRVYNGNDVLDNWTAERVHATEVPRRIPRCVPSHGTNGRQSVPGDPNGPGPRTDELPALSDVVRH